MSESKLRHFGLCAQVVYMLTATKLTVQSCLLILIWAQSCSKKLYCAPLHEQKLFKDWLLCGEEKLRSSKKQHWLVFYYIVFLQRTRTWKQLSSWAVLALTSRSSLMNSICKKTGEEKENACDQRNKIICIFCHASDPLEWCKMWCTWRKTNSMSRYKAVFVSAAFNGISSANVSLENQRAAKNCFFDDLFLLWWIAGILCLIFRKPSSLLQGHVRMPRSLSLTNHIVPCSYILNLGWSLYIFWCLLSTPTISNI